VKTRIESLEARAKMQATKSKISSFRVSSGRNGFIQGPLKEGALVSRREKSWGFPEGQLTKTGKNPNNKP